MLEVGNRLVDRRRLMAVGDVFLAEKSELEAALIDPTLDLRPAVARRRAEMGGGASRIGLRRRVRCSALPARSCATPGER